MIQRSTQILEGQLMQGRILQLVVKIGCQVFHKDHEADEKVHYQSPPDPHVQELQENHLVLHLELFLEVMVQKKKQRQVLDWYWYFEQRI
jgi:hypothetical protein